MAEAPLPLLDAPSARPVLADVQARLAAAGIGFRPPPAEPTTCCGRGCNGCVWEGWLAAANWWCEQALALLDGAPPGPISPAENPPGPAVHAAPGPDHPP